MQQKNTFNGHKHSLPSKTCERDVKGRQPWAKNMEQVLHGLGVHRKNKASTLK